MISNTYLECWLWAKNYRECLTHVSWWLKESACNAGDSGNTVQSLGWEHPLEKGKATHSGILARGVPWTEEPGGLLSTGSPRARHDWVTALSL